MMLVFMMSVLKHKWEVEIMQTVYRERY